MALQPDGIRKGANHFGDLADDRQAGGGDDVVSGCEKGGFPHADHKAARFQLQLQLALCNLRGESLLKGGEGLGQVGRVVLRLQARGKRVFSRWLVGSCD